MNRLLPLLFVILLAPLHAAQAMPRLIPDAPAVDARGYVLLDYHSGHLLAERNSGERLEPASLTKMMTAYAVFHELRAGQIKLGDMVRVSKKAWRMPGSRMFIEVGSSVSVEELLKGMIIQSGNDASVALAEHVAGSEETFAALMNEHARNIGMSATHFVNATGLPDPEHYSTARDLARLAAVLIREFPEYYTWYSEKEYTYGGITQQNRNLLLYRDNTVDGFKTGHTESAGFCLVASAKRGEMRLISVVMGTKSESARANESQKLLNYGFRFFETHKLYDAGQPLKAMRVWKGASDTVQLGLDESLYITVPRGQYSKLSASLSVENAIIAPTSKGQNLGSVNVRLGDEVLAERPLIALEEVAEGSLWQRLFDNVRMLLQ
ncbi:MAG: serine-type D-Ala-D-Ala carboxypeptidase [Gammaproteobacteria bacterium HGW-Gammaproteobacteria-1]|jgi:D-alanyl-D-alanine carboxypeptidase (penicillin-binding protein 5/6)|nr:MAG: serine-type D-Ala-D-Ala carboxypeptidase [Gammaproteobacteria bacterium HGW-Gammaproteobacteria-1]